MSELVPVPPVAVPAVVPAVAPVRGLPAVAWRRPDPLDRLPGTADDDPFLRLAAAFLVAHPANTATAYRRDLTAWARWCEHLGIHPLAAERHHVDAWVRHLSTQPQPATGRPAAASTIARRLSALSGFYDYGIHTAAVLTHSPVASVRRPRVSDESAAIGLTADQLRRLLDVAAQHSPRSQALVCLLTYCGLRIGEALGAQARDYDHDHGHRVLRVVRKGGKRARIPLAPPVVRALDAYLAGRTDGPLLLATPSPRQSAGSGAASGAASTSAAADTGGATDLAADFLGSVDSLGSVGSQTAGGGPRSTAAPLRGYSYTSAYEQLLRLYRRADLPRSASPHSLRHSYATEALRLGAALQDVQDALGHADPRTTRRYDRSRHNLDRSPNYLLATALTRET